MSVFTNPAGRAPAQAAAYVEAVLGLLGDKHPLTVLEGTYAALSMTARRRPEADLIRPEAEGKWSVRDVVAHLADAELVWSYRLRMVLAETRPELAGYDQDAWCAALHYRDQPLAMALGQFETLRSVNLWHLQRADEGTLARVGIHRERGEESVGFMVRLYAGHDLLHLNQIERILSRRPA